MLTLCYHFGTITLFFIWSPCMLLVSMRSFYLCEYRLCKNQRIEKIPTLQGIKQVSMRIQGGDTKSFAYFFLVSLIKDFNKGCIPCFTDTNQEGCLKSSSYFKVVHLFFARVSSLFEYVKQGIQPLLKSLIRDTKKKYAKLFVSPPCIRIDSISSSFLVSLIEDFKGARLVSLLWFLHVSLLCLNT